MQWKNFEEVSGTDTKTSRVIQNSRNIEISEIKISSDTNNPLNARIISQRVKKYGHYTSVY